MSAVNAENPFELDLSSRALIRQGFRPLRVGDDCSIRLQMLTPEGLARDLTGLTVLRLTIKKGGSTLVRNLDVIIAGTSTKEAARDPDQSGESGETGRGWVTFNFASTPGEVSAEDRICGDLADFEVCGAVGTFYEEGWAGGKIQFVLPLGGRPLT